MVWKLPREKITTVFKAEPKLNLLCILKHAVHFGFAPAMQFANNVEWLGLFGDFTHVFLFVRQNRNAHCQPIECQLLSNYSAQMVGWSAELDRLSCLFSMFQDSCSYSHVLWGCTFETWYQSVDPFLHSSLNSQDFSPHCIVCFLPTPTLWHNSQEHVCKLVSWWSGISHTLLASSVTIATFCWVVFPALYPTPSVED